MSKALLVAICVIMMLSCSNGNVEANNSSPDVPEQKRLIFDSLKDLYNRELFTLDSLVYIQRNSLVVDEDLQRVIDTQRKKTDELFETMTNARKEQ